MRKTYRKCVTIAAASIYILNCVFRAESCVKNSSCMEGSMVSFASEDRWRSRTWSRDIICWKSKQPGCAVVAWWKRYLVAITDGNRWFSKGASAYSCPLTIILRHNHRHWTTGRQTDRNATTYRALHADARAIKIAAVASLCRSSFILVFDLKRPYSNPRGTPYLQKYKYRRAYYLILGRFSC